MCMPELDDIWKQFVDELLKFTIEVNDIAIYKRSVKARYKCIHESDRHNLQTMVFLHPQTGDLIRIRVDISYQSEIAKECIDIYADNAILAEQLKNISCIETIETLMKDMKEIYQQDQLLVKLKYGI